MYPVTQAYFHLECDSNQISILDVTNLTGIVTMICSQNKLEVLNITSSNDPMRLDCERNQLPYKNLQSISEVPEYSSFLYTLCPQNNSDRIFNLEVAFGDTVDIAADDTGSVTQYEWYQDDFSIDDGFSSEGQLYIEAFTVEQFGDFFYRSVNPLCPGDTLISALYRIDYTGSPPVEESPQLNNELILDFDGVSDSLRAYVLNILMNTPGAYLIDSCACGGPQLWGHAR